MDRENNRKRWELLAAHEQRLGRVCMVWATIDSTLDTLLQTLLETRPEKVAAIVTNVKEAAGKCEILKRLITIDSPGKAWRAWFIGLLDRVSGEIGPTRNRYIHDHWNVSTDEIVRRDRRAKILRSQAFADEVLTWDVAYTTPGDEIDKWEMAALLVMAMLQHADYDLHVWQREARPLEPIEQYIPAIKRNARWLTPREYAEALRLKQKPPEYLFD